MRRHPDEVEAEFVPADETEVVAAAPHIGKLEETEGEGEEGEEGEAGNGGEEKGEGEGEGEG